MELLGSLEEIVLMIVLQQEECHGVMIAQQYESILDKTISLPAIHVVLKRMEKKGWIRSRFGKPTAQRGGKRKRLYQATPAGYHVVRQLQATKARLWAGSIQPTVKYETV